MLAAAVERILPSDDGPGPQKPGRRAYVEQFLLARWRSGEFATK